MFRGHHFRLDGRVVCAIGPGGALSEKTPARGNHGGGERADRSDERPTGCCGAGRAREDATDSARFHDREVRP